MQPKSADGSASLLPDLERPDPVPPFSGPRLPDPSPDPGGEFVEPDPPCGEETCNGADDDCDEVIDEGDDCPCELVRLADGPRLLCSEERLNYVAAARHCAEVGYRLASVDDSEEQLGLVPHLRAGNWWIGLSDAVSEGNWMWMDGRGPSYTNWGPGQPDNGGEQEHCAEIRLPTGDWNDAICAKSNKYVCEPP